MDTMEVEYRRNSPKRSRSPPVHSRSPPPTRDSRDSRTRDPPEPTNILGIFGLHPSTRERILEEVFRPWNPKQIKLVTTREGESRGFAFITFDSVDDATQALQETNGKEVDRRIVRVDYSVTRTAHNPTPGRYMGKRRFWERREYERPSDRRRDDRYERREYDRDDRGYEKSDRYDRRREYDRGHEREYNRDRREYRRSRSRERY